MSVFLNLRQILFGSPDASAPVRSNFTDIQNAVNDLQAQINALATPPAGTEVTNARDYHAILRDRLRSGFNFFSKYLVSGGGVAEQTVPDMTVAVDAGEAVVNGIGLIWAAQNSGTIIAPVTDSRWDLVVINDDNTLSIETGSESASPVLPTPSATQKKLAQILLYPGMTAITDADIRLTPYEIKDNYFNDLFFESIGENSKQFTYTGELITTTTYKDADDIVIATVTYGYTGDLITTCLIQIGGRAWLKTLTYSNDLVVSTSTIEVGV